MCFDQLLDEDLFYIQTAFSKRNHTPYQKQLC